MGSERWLRSVRWHAHQAREHHLTAVQRIGDQPQVVGQVSRADRAASEDELDTEHHQEPTEYCFVDFGKGALSGLNQCQEFRLDPSLKGTEGIPGDISIVGR